MRVAIDRGCGQRRDVPRLAHNDREPRARGFGPSRFAQKRGSNARRGNAADLSDVPDPNPSPAEQAALGDERARALKLLDSLPPDYRLPLLLRYIGGADYDEIGKQLAISNGSLRGLLQRGLKLLRERMKE